MLELTEIGTFLQVTTVIYQGKMYNKVMDSLQFTSVFPIYCMLQVGDKWEIAACSSCKPAGSHGPELRGERQAVVTQLILLNPHTHYSLPPSLLLPRQLGFIEDADKQFRKF